MLEAELRGPERARSWPLGLVAGLVTVAALALTSCGGGSPSGPSGGSGGSGGGSGGAVSGAISVQNAPCVADATVPVTCTFTATASGGQAPYSFAWKFTIGGNTSTQVPATGASVSPTFQCGFSAGVATFNVAVEVTITPATGTPQTITSTQQVARKSGACGVA